MTLDEFKGIYFWEWLHRFWDRLIGIVFALPLLWFAVRKKIDKRLALYLTGILVLGALQGFIGWYMVESGLSVRTSVSQYRLALHLFFALFIYALMLWIALDLYGVKLTPSTWCLRRHGWISLAFLTLTMIWGAFTAGLHAGEAYNTWPLMEGEIIPSAAFTILPKRLNVFQNLALVQFIHRWLGPTTALIILSWVWRLWRKDDLNKGWLAALGMMAILQVALGITTVLTHANIVIATIHQVGAITLLTLLLINLRKLDARKLLPLQADVKKPAAPKIIVPCQRRRIKFFRFVREIEKPAPLRERYDVVAFAMADKQRAFNAADLAEISS